MLQARALFESLKSPGLFGNSPEPCALFFA